MTHGGAPTASGQDESFHRRKLAVGLVNGMFQALDVSYVDATLDAQLGLTLVGGQVRAYREQFVLDKGYQALVGLIGKIGLQQAEMG
jgi:hypothetical protein